MMYSAYFNSSKTAAGGNVSVSALQAPLTPAAVPPKFLSLPKEEDLKEVSVVPHTTPEGAYVPMTASELRRAGKRTHSQRKKGHPKDCVFALQKPFTLKTRLPDNRPFSYSAKYSATLTSSTVADVFNAYYFFVDAMNNVTSLKDLFDQYRITEVEIMFLPRGAATTSSQPGRFTTVIDYDDETPLVSEAAAFDYVNAITCSGIDGQYRTFRPHVAMATYSGAFTSYGNLTSPWIDATSGTVRHYGVKVAWTTTSAEITYDIIVQLHTEWRNIR